MDKYPPKSEFVLDSDLIYLNTAALGPTPHAVLNCIQQASQELAAYPNRSSDSADIYSLAQGVCEQAANFIGCDADEVQMTRGTTDSMNTIAQSLRLNVGDRVLTTDREHEGGSACWQYLARRDGVLIDVVPIALADQDPQAIVQRFAAAITSRTRVISVSHVIASTGLRMPIKEIAGLARERGMLCVVDGAQAVGNIEVDMKALGCHAYATSGHKWLMGPKGTGLLYIARDISSGAAAAIDPIQRERANLYLGNPALVLGLGVAIEAMQSRGMQDVESHNIALRNRAYVRLTQIPTIQIVGPPPGPRATAILSCKLPANIGSEHLCITLRDKHRIAVKMVEKQWFNGIRIAPHVFNTEADIDALVTAVRTILA